MEAASQVLGGSFNFFINLYYLYVQTNICYICRLK